MTTSRFDRPARLGSGRHRSRWRAEWAKIGCAAAFSVVVTGCLAPAQERTAQPAAPLFPVMEVNRNEVPAGTPAAFEAAFGPSPRNESVRQVDGRNVTYVPLTMIPLPGDKIALVSTGESDCDGHDCSGVNAVHYLARDSDQVGYLVSGEWLEIGAGGTFGRAAARWGWTDAIAGVPVLYTEGGGTMQGYICMIASLTELRATGPVEVARIPIAYSNANAADSASIRLTGQISAAVRDRSVTVTYTGSRTFAERYDRDADGRYRLQGNSQLDSCT